ncbi:thyroid receptor-interacting protein 11 [Plakobranchus ocellatus]|uniref:Thyroid receptor-interacting protein 11 n=1 Tax=Plakobranchus ocellatus TaxID=259542 RepID=A0AAV4CUT5_9GAST|nr:thyroid receptor-interacting protein 11 [Plakobranchus ocellatus]
MQRRDDMWVERRSIVNQMFRVGQQHKQASQSLQDAQREQAEAMANAEATLEKLGDGDGPQNLTKELFASVEKENLVLQEEVLKLREQQVLLEKAASTASAQRAALQEKVTVLRGKLRTYTDDEEDTDDTHDADFSPPNSGEGSLQNAALHITAAEIDEELKSLRAQLKQQTSDLADVELERADWDMEREALEEVVTELRSKTQKQEEEIKSLKSGSSSSLEATRAEATNKALDSKLASLEAEIASLREEKAELGVALEELDTQHNLALEQLISQRDELSVKLAECNTQIAGQQEQVQQLEELVEQLRQEAATVTGAAVTAAETTTARSTEENSDSSVPMKDAEIAELKEKLQKGGLVINDLHMDKQELQEELRKAKEETELKVVKLKEIREENTRLAADKKALEGRLEEVEGRLQEAEEDLEQWERRNEETQVEKLSAGAVKEEECEKLKSQVEALTQEKEVFSQKLLSGIAAGPAGETPDFASIEDPVLRNILEQEAKAREQMEKDGKLIEELRQQVQKLYDNKQVLKRELAELQAFKESTIEKLMDVEGELQDARYQIDSLKAEKAGMQEAMVDKSKTVEELKSKLSEAELDRDRVNKQREKLREELDIQQKLFDTFTQELRQSQQMGAESLQAEHQQLLDSHRELNLEVERLKATTKEKSELEAQLSAKTRENSELASKAATLVEELASVQTHISKLESACEQKDLEIVDLQQRMAQFDTDLNEIEESVSIAEEKHREEVLDKEKHLEELKAHRDGLERSLSQVSVELEQAVQARQVLERSLSSQDHGFSASQAVVTNGSSDEQTKVSFPSEERGDEDVNDRVSKLETELVLRNSVIEQLERDLAVAQDMVRRQEVGISDLNDKTAESRQLLEKAEEQVSRQQSTIAVMRQASRDKDLLLEEVQAKLSILIPTLSEFQVQKLKSYLGATVLPALEYQDIKAIEFHQPVEEEMKQEVGSMQKNSVVIEEVRDAAANLQDEFEDTGSDRERLALMERDIEALRKRLKEKDVVVTELQKSNSSLLSLLEKGSGAQGLVDHVAAHKLEAELQNLRAEREQMVAVMTEKSRENSSLKSEVHRLMEVVSAGQSALAKLQGDNQSLQQQQQQQQQHQGHLRGVAGDGDDDDMRREALTNMARLVRDRETEIEALKQKNETLLAVLQENGGGHDAQAEGAGTQVASLLQEKEQLTQQVAAMSAEREQLIACITQKHSEAVAYHGEVQRLLGVLADLTAAKDQAEADYAAIVPAFEDKSQALVSVQGELVQCKQKLSDLEVRHGELIQRSSSLDSNTNRGGAAPELASLEEELERLRSSEAELSLSLSQRDEKVHSLSQQVKVLEEDIIQKETECAHLRKQVENSKFQLTGLMSEIADVRAERDSLQHKVKQQDSESASLHEQVSRLFSECQGKDTELTSLREQVTSLTSRLEQQGSGGNTDRDEETGQLARLVREYESLSAQAMQLQQERGHHAAVAEQRTRECQQLQAEVEHWKEKEVKQNKELQRLREHLIEIEDGYTKEALESEEREKNLRNRLAVAEEELSSSSSHIELASMESRRQVESLQAQVHHASAQRDAAYSQVASSQEQVRQLSQSLANLQLVLEQFQREKDSAVAAETERLQIVCNKLKEQVASQKKELEDTRADLADALEGLEAANRLSEQLDRKEEAMAALKEEAGNPEVIGWLRVPVGISRVRAAIRRFPAAQRPASLQSGLEAASDPTQH